MEDLIRKVFGGLFDSRTALPRVLRSIALGVAIWLSGDQAGAVDHFVAILGGAAGLLGAGEMNK